MSQLRPKFIAVSALIVCLLLINVMLGATIVDLDPDDGLMEAAVPGLLIGQYIGQLNLISVWAAVSCGSMILRLPWALLLTVLMWGSLVFGLYVAGDWIPSQPSTDTFFYGMLLGYGSLVTQIPLWIASRAFRWRLVATDDDPDNLAGQFNLQQMFVGTVLLAGTLSICRWILSDFKWGEMWSSLPPWQMWAFLVPLAFCNLVFVVPVIWAAFLVKATPGKLLVATVLLALVGPIELFVICVFLGDAPSLSDLPGWILFFSMLHLGQVFLVYGTLVLLKRLAGFRLIRIEAR